MKIVTIGSFKGGTGKTTMAAVLGTAMTLRGLKVRVIELETQTKPLARYQASREFADLDGPKVTDLNVSGGTPDVKDWQMTFSSVKADAERAGIDVVIIDTTSVWKPEVIAAHLMADLVLTTVTESPIDLYQIMPTEGPSMQAVRPYAQLIDLVRRHAEKAERTNFDWFLCLNRKSHLITRVGERVRDRLTEFTDESRIQMVEGLVDRVGYRNMMDTGITPMDVIAGQPVQRSQIAARTEVNRLASRVVARLGLKVDADQFERV